MLFRSENGVLVNVSTGRRSSLTSCRDALNGYQKGKCFYCFQEISIVANALDLADIDHFHPRMLMQSSLSVQLDGVWNLVLACRDCNRGADGKSSRLPERKFLQRLDTRNEFLIASHHPLRETLMAQTGTNRDERIRFLNEVFTVAAESLIHRWKPRYEHETAF